MAQTETPARATAPANARGLQAVVLMTRRVLRETLGLRRLWRLKGDVLSDDTTDLTLVGDSSPSSPRDPPNARADRRPAGHRALQGQDVEASAAQLDSAAEPRGARGQWPARVPVRDPALLVVDDLASAFDLETEQALRERPSHTSTGTPLHVSEGR